MLPGFIHESTSVPSRNSAPSKIARATAENHNVEDALLPLVIAARAEAGAILPIHPSLPHPARLRLDQGGRTRNQQIGAFSKPVRELLAPPFKPAFANILFFQGHGTRTSADA